MEGLKRPSLAMVGADLEDLWAKFDQLYTTINPEDWNKKFGKDWTFADQPYHLAFFDRIMSADPLAKGESVLESDRWLVRTFEDIDKWNDQEFAKRPPGQTPQQSLEQWKASREAIRKAMASMNESNQDRKVWVPLIGEMFTGHWVTARDAVLCSLVHSVGEYTELRMRLGRRDPTPTPSAIHTRLDFMMRFMGASVNPEEAKKTTFTSVMQYTGPGSGAWTFRVRNGGCVVTEESDAKPHVAMTMSFDTFEKMLRKMNNPMLLMLTRQMKVRGMSKLGTFNRLFPSP